LAIYIVYLLPGAASLCTHFSLGSRAPDQACRITQLYGKPTLRQCHTVCGLRFPLVAVVSLTSLSFPSLPCAACCSCLLLLLAAACCCCCCCCLLLLLLLLLLLVAVAHQSEVILRCGLSPYQSALYYIVKAALRAERVKAPGAAAAAAATRGVKGVNNTVMELRCICNHPMLRCVAVSVTAVLLSELPTTCPAVRGFSVRGMSCHQLCFLVPAEFKTAV